MFVQRFINDESGAFTLDWMVLVGGLIAIALTATIWISSGLENQSTDISYTMAEMEPSTHHEGFGVNPDL
jgi:Flp pilus assembly pilin Flp